MVLISACLLGIRCRYDNKILKLKPYQQTIIKNLIKNNIVMPVCPEQLGGLATPRPLAKITKNKVMYAQGIDVTKNFEQGATQVVKLFKLFKIKTAYLKNRSPSCGKLGITTRKLQKLGIKIHFI